MGKKSNTGSIKMSSATNTSYFQYCSKMPISTHRHTQYGITKMLIASGRWLEKKNILEYNFDLKNKKKKTVLLSFALFMKTFPN